MPDAVPIDSRHTRGAIVVLSFGAFAVGTGLFALNGVLPEAARDLGVSTASIGQAVTVFAVVYAIGAPLLAALVSRFPLKRVLLVALLLLCLGNTLTAAAPNLLVLLLSRVVAALGAATYTPAALGAAAALAGGARAGAALAAVQAGLNGALAIGVPIGLALSAVFSWRSAPMVVSVLAVIALIAVALASGPLPQASHSRLQDIGAVLRRREVLTALSVTVLVVAAGISAYTYVAEVLAVTAHAQSRGLFVLLVVYGLGAFVGTLVAGPLVDRFGPRRVLLAAVAMQAIALALVPAVHVVAFVVPVLAMWGAAFTASTPPQQVRLIELEPRLPTVAVSLNSSGVYVGQGLGAVIGGLVLALGVVPSALPLAAAALAVLALSVAALRMRPRSTAAPRY